MLYISDCLHRCSVEIFIQQKFLQPICFFLFVFFLPVLLASQLCLFLMACLPEGSPLKTHFLVCLAHLCWICSGWLSSVSAMTSEPTVGGWISQNAWFGVRFHWEPHYFAKGHSREDIFLRNQILSGCASLEFFGS